MRNIFREILVLGLIGLAHSAWAGLAYDEKIECPIGGKRVQTTETMSCSTSSAITMSLRRPSSCDFVTRLPVCQKEAFPIYREFSSEETALLEKITTTDWYQKAKSESRFLRAYLIENELKTYSKEEMFWLLQSGHSYDPKHTYGNRAYFAAFRDAADAYVKVAGNEDKKLILLATAFAQIHSNEPQMALVMLESAARYSTPDVPFFDQYLELVKQCVNQPSSSKCSPEHVFDIE